MKISDPNINEILERLQTLRSAASPGRWSVEGHQIVDADGQVVARFGARHAAQRANADLVVFLQQHAPILILEIQRLRRILGGTSVTTVPADYSEAIDRVVGMLEEAEREAACMKVLVGLCSSCSSLVEPPFEPCRHQLTDFTIDHTFDDGKVVRARFADLEYPPKPIALPKPHRCELREQGMAGGDDNFRCTCCARCTSECTHSV